MASKIDVTEISSTELIIAVNELFLDTSYGVVPGIDRFKALETYLAFEDGGLAEVPNALAAYISNQQHNAA